MYYYIGTLFVATTLACIFTWLRLRSRTRAWEHAKKCSIIRSEIVELAFHERCISTHLAFTLERLAKRMKSYMSNVYCNAYSWSQLASEGEEILHDARRLRDCARRDIERRRAAHAYYSRTFPKIYRALGEHAVYTNKDLRRVWQRMLGASLDTRGPGIFRAVRDLRKLEKQYGEPAEKTSITAHKPHPTDFASRFA